ncbi:phage holin family protein [Glycomyces paridis]|jgi:putative membrane protein|uniref:Phage holin family protein n=1 Tax=Glycomyces paridis TaxID=2126555 RepID=A0A4V4HPC4_9ACTN|nr:phage holin family protein [Glycomyces paridis]THV29456.1 phage holin family protein [Glycomyces paridis]
MRFLTRTLVTAAALALAVLIVDGIELDGSGPVRNAFTLIGVALVFGLVNALIKPLVRKVGGCVYVVTLGLAALVVNGLLFLLTAWIADQMGLPFAIDGFWSAFWGALIVAVAGWLIGLAVPDRKTE